MFRFDSADFRNIDSWGSINIVMMTVTMVVPVAMAAVILGAAVSSSSAAAADLGLRDHPIVSSGPTV